jgi:thiol-disulfide isomerase/thioredoxin
MNNQLRKYPCAYACGVLFLVLVWAGCAPKLDEDDPAGRAPIVAPTVAVPALNSTEQVSIEDYRGRVLLLDFWATWSAQSLQERPDMIRLYEALSGEPFALLSFALDAPTEETTARIAALELPFPLGMADADVLQAYGAGRAIPTKILLDREGRIIQTYSGHASFALMREDIDALLQAP